MTKSSFNNTFRYLLKQTVRNRNRTHTETASNKLEPLYDGLDQNIDHVKATLGNSTDLVIREFRIGSSGHRAATLYTDGLADNVTINGFLETIMLRQSEESGNVTAEKTIEFLRESALTLGAIRDVSDFQTLFLNLLSGDTILLVDGSPQGIIACTRDWEDRGVQEASVQTVVRGSREAFSENLRTNTALIRRRIKDPKLWLETKRIGEITHTDVAIMYMKGIANDQIVEEVHRRLNRINIDFILESGNIEELIQDETFTLFPTVYNTERPDSVAANLLEGRIAILVDGTPVVLLVPVMFVQFFQSAEDYYHRSDFGLIRMLRVISFFITLLAPSLYIAITTFHQEMLPTTLMISIAAQREGVPFPAAVEAYLMEFTFEILREAGIRMPRAIGPAISIVGALVLGEAAVQAGLVSSAMVIVVSITAITSFVFPSFSMAISVRMLRFGLMALAASFGLYGIFIGLITLSLHLSSLRSFGIPYMAPLAPFNADDQKDSLFRFPLWAMRTRPRLVSQKEIVREHMPPPKPDSE